MNLAVALQELEKALPPDTIFTTDAGNFATWPTRFMHLTEGQDFLGPTNGAMGYGVPAAIGAKIVHPERTVVCFVGDGGFLMTGQEIATAFHHSVAPIILVFNNQMYGTIRMHQERTYPGRVSGTSLTNPDFAKFIESFGGHGEVVERTEELVPAFQRAQASGRVRTREEITALFTGLTPGGGGVVHISEWTTPEGSPAFEGGGNVVSLDDPDVVKTVPIMCGIARIDR